jgi:outer membrane immunogenic protein
MLKRGISVKKISLLATISQLALVAGGVANAADLSLKAPRMVAPPAYSWTGCYAGVHVGYGWGRHDVTASNFSFGPGGTPISATNTLDSSGGIYGGQVGCNYQFAGNWVIGIQGDIAGTDIRGDVADPFDRFNEGNPAGTVGVKTDWIASVTGRLGITAWNNQALFYVKGGAAWDKSRWDLSRSSYCRFYGGCLNTGPDDRRTGWTVGGGVEWVISPAWSNWTAFAEYNYYDFGSDGPSVAVGLNFLDPRNAISSAKQQIQTVKVGINYKLFNP